MSIYNMSISQHCGIMLMMDYTLSSNVCTSRGNNYHRLPGKDNSRKVVTLNRVHRSFDESYEDRTVSASQSQVSLPFFKEMFVFHHLNSTFLIHSKIL